MTQAVTAKDPSTADQPGTMRPESVLPELRAMWWETGVRARADAGVFARLRRAAAAGRGRRVGVSWRADRTRTVGRGRGDARRRGDGDLRAAGHPAGPGRAVRRRADPGPGDARRCPRWSCWPRRPRVRAGMGIATGLRPERADAAGEPGGGAAAVRGHHRGAAGRLRRRTRSPTTWNAPPAAPTSAIGLVQGAMNLLAGLVGVLAVDRRGRRDPPAAAGRAAGRDGARTRGRRCGPGTSGIRPTWPARCAGAGCGSCNG